MSNLQKSLFDYLGDSTQRCHVSPGKPEADSIDVICRAINVNNNQPGWPDRFGRALHAYINSNHCKSIRTLSLFSGAGGLDIGFSDLGFDIVESVEIENTFCETLKNNTGNGKYFSNSSVNCIDIRKYTVDHLKDIDFIIGGPPCQTFSAAGRRANGVLGTTDARGVLFKEYVRILKELSPKGFLFENVYGIVGAQGGEPWKEIIDCFSEIGYRLFYRIIDAADYGVPQHRERLIIVGLKSGSFKFPKPTHGPDSINKTPFYNAKTAVAGVVLSDEEKRIGIGGKLGNLLFDIPPGLNYSFYTEKLGHPKPIFAWRSKFSDYLYKADPDTPVRTIKASGGAYTGPFHWDNRKFSIAEHKRLQTFPDVYNISGSNQAVLKQIGNSVPPQLARMLALAIRMQVFGTSFPFKLPLLEQNEKLGFRERKRELTEVYIAKAKTALAGSAQNEIDISSVTFKNQYSVSMDEEFELTVSDKQDKEYRVSIEWDSSKIEINIRDKAYRCKKASATLDIKPALNWIISSPNVHINIYSNGIESITVAWKVFESELNKRNIKADLVQLNGYYQYQPLLSNELVMNKPAIYSEQLIKITSGIGVSNIMTTNEMSAVYAIDKVNVLDFAVFLRKLGYEIRNHKTNPQIPEDCWLIPYTFPTLTKLSVQLRKSLS